MAIFNGWRITRTGILFIAGVIVLAGLVFGGVYWVSQRGEQARREEAIAVAEENLEEQSPPVVVNEQESGPAPEQNGGSSADDEAEERPAALPETGPELGGLLAAATLTLAGAYYLQSRRTARGL